MECCTTSFFNYCLASNINLVLLGTYIIAKIPHFDPFRGNEILMNQNQVRKQICLRRIYNFRLFHANILQLSYTFGNFLYYFWD